MLHFACVRAWIVNEGQVVHGNNSKIHKHGIRLRLAVRGRDWQ